MNNRLEELKRHCRNICTEYAIGWRIFIDYALNEIGKYLSDEEYNDFLSELNQICMNRGE